MRNIKTDSNNRPLIIGVAGKKQSGKDTFGKLLQAIDSDYENKKFSNKLKEVVSMLTGYSVALLEEEDIKNQRLGATFKGLTIRELLQQLGTEVFRNNFDDDIWVNLLFNSYSEGKWVITDVRFQNEVDMIKQYGGIVVKVERASTDSEDTHISENLVDRFEYDYIIKNNGRPVDMLKDIEIILANEKFRTTH